MVFPEPKHRRPPQSTYSSKQGSTGMPYVEFINETWNTQPFRKNKKKKSPVRRRRKQAQKTYEAGGFDGNLGPPTNVRPPFLPGRKKKTEGRKESKEGIATPPFITSTLRYNIRDLPPFRFLCSTCTSPNQLFLVEPCITPLLYSRTTFTTHRTQILSRSVWKRCRQAVPAL
jgi:hypothetical protein